MLILPLCGFAAWLGLSAFESSFLVLLAAPIGAHALGMAGIEPNRWVYLLLLLAGLGFCRFFKRSNAALPWRDNFWPVLVFAAAYVVLYGLSMLWPDFIPIGERLRDYSLLAAVIRAPLTANEPWMHGSSLNYYLYWYRFGHLIASVLDMKAWQVYHILAAFSSAFYLTACFQLFSKHLGFTKGAAVFCALLIALGSNAAGVQNFVEGNDNWWGPSRVVKGAIDEFPAWSFVLGDLHPHYLNLGLIPFLLGLVLVFFKNARGCLDYALTVVFAGPVCLIWMYNANAWEVPIWAAVCGFFTFSMVRYWIKYPEDFRCKLDRTLWKQEEPLKGLALLLLCLLFFVSLWHSSRNIIPNNYPLRWVKEPVQGTPLKELLLHWGVPMALIAASLAAFFKTKESWLICGALYVGAVLSNEATPVLLVLLGLTICVLFVSPLPQTAKSPFDPAPAAAGIGLSGLALVLLPEYAFLDDPYGADIERMNTIFKIYSAAWFMIWVYAFAVTRSSFGSWYAAVSQNSPAYLLKTAFAILLLGFFNQAAHLRKNERHDIKPIAQGLSSVNRHFPGAGEAIRFLGNQPPGVVLEAQGNPYDWTSHMATLSDKDSYLGWKNHVELLTKKYDEARRRDEVTTAIYNEPSCDEKRRILKDESIAYVVVGPLEKGRYHALGDENLGCLKDLFSAGEYRLLAP